MGWFFFKGGTSLLQFQEDQALHTEADDTCPVDQLCFQGTMWIKQKPFVALSSNRKYIQNAFAHLFYLFSQNLFFILMGQRTGLGFKVNTLGFWICMVLGKPTVCWRKQISRNILNDSFCRRHGNSKQQGISGEAHDFPGEDEFTPGLILSMMLGMAFQSEFKLKLSEEQYVYGINSK